MRRRLPRVALGAAVAIILIMSLASVAFAAPGGGHGPKSTTAEGPTVQRVAPDSGPAAGGAKVVIRGKGFTGATGVAFGGVSAASYKVLNSRVIMAVSPAGTAGQAVDVTVTTPAGTSATGSADLYTYKEAAAAPKGNKQKTESAPVVRQVAPKAGPITGGVRVMVRGDGFKEATAVTFGAVPATSFKVLSTHVITAVSPAGTVAGPVDVTVTTASGTSAISTADLYTYKAVEPPVVRHIAPKSGGPAEGGARVLIIGDNFFGVTAVTFGALPAASFKVLNSHVIVATSPAGTAGQAVDVTVTTPMGTSSVNSGAMYMYKVRQTV